MVIMIHPLWSYMFDIFPHYCSISMLLLTCVFFCCLYNIYLSNLYLFFQLLYSLQLLFSLFIQSHIITDYDCVFIVYQVNCNDSYSTCRLPEKALWILGWPL